MTSFLKINETRIKRSVVKKYCPNGDTKLNIYYNTSRDRVMVETFSFDSKEERDEFLYFMDSIF